MHIKLSADAQQDIASIASFGKECWGALQSQSYILDMYDALELIGTQPEIGEVYRPRNTDPDIRVIPQGAHLIFYAAYVDEVFVLRVLGKDQLPERHLG